MHLPVAYTQAVATSAGVATSAISGLTATQGRRLLAGVNMVYQINTATITPIFFGGVAASPTSSQVENCHPTYFKYSHLFDA